MLPSSNGADPFDFFLRSVLVSESNFRAHNIVSSMKAAVNLARDEINPSLSGEERCCVQVGDTEVPGQPWEAP